MSRSIKPIGVRIPEELRDWLRKQAEQNHRSMNGEIIARLEQSQRINEILATGARRPDSHEAELAERLSAALREVRS